jgi:hypothetical protein
MYTVKESIKTKPFPSKSSEIIVQTEKYKPISGETETLVQSNRIYFFPLFKGIVQRKLTGVENNTYSYLLSQCCGAGLYFVILLCRHLIISILYFHFKLVLPIKAGVELRIFWSNFSSAGIVDPTLLVL